MRFRINGAGPGDDGTKASGRRMPDRRLQGETSAGEQIDEWTENIESELDGKTVEEKQRFFNTFVSSLFPTVTALGGLLMNNVCVCVCVCVCV